MERKPVKSSQIASIGWDAETAVLEVEFAKGGIYQYQDVPKTTYDELMAAESVGKFFGQFVRGKFPTTKLLPEPKAEGATQ